MSITSPPRPPRPSDPVTREDVEALIEEARQRARRRRQKYAAVAAVVSLAGIVVLTILDRTARTPTASPAFAARSSVAQGASSQIAFSTSGRTHCQNPPSCTGNPSQGSDAFNGKLYVVDADGSGLRLLADRASIATPPAWSPDGQELAFNRQTGPGLTGGISVVNIDGSGLRSLTNGGAPAWSPDGQKILFVRSVGTLTQWVRDGLGPNSEIFVVNPDGSGLQNLTRNPRPDTAPAWSPDGQKIAFRRIIGAGCGHGGCGGGQSILYVMNADGSGQLNLTRNPSFDEGAEARYVWSPDGQKIAFQRRSKGKNWEIYVISADGSGERNLSRNPSHDMDASWSPDGRRIVFRSSRHGRWELYAMNADGSGQQRLTRTAANESRPSWSPDGSQIAFTREVGSNFDLYVMNADGSGQRRLTPNSTVDRWVAFAWSPTA